MSINIQNATVQRHSEIPFDSIIRQVASPSAYQEAHNSKLTVPIMTQPIASFSAPPQMIETAQFVSGSRSKPMARTVAQPIPADMPSLPPTRRVEYVPYEQRYIEYVEQRIKVPVQRVCTDYYQVEHIIDYMPIEKEEVVYEIQPKEVVTMRLQYVPVEQKIIHISDKNAQALGIKDYVSTDAKDIQQNIVEKSPLYQVIAVSNAGEGLKKSSASSIRKSRTNFVTSEGYDPQANLQQIDNLLSASSVRGSRVREQQ